ncbi:hypothetical protein OROGR_033093 [Orobanche gracilis]
MKVIIHLYDGGSYQGESFHICPNSTHFSLVPGHAIAAVGRYFAKPFDLMAAPDHKKCGEVGALINLSGEVIGITFCYEYGFTTPFMPINIALKFWEHYKRYGGLRRPSLGDEATNFYPTGIYHLKKVIQKIPSICNGVLVEKDTQVIQSSCVDSTGLHLKDVIVQCGGKTVHSFLESFIDKNACMASTSLRELDLSISSYSQETLVKEPLASSLLGLLKHHKFAPIFRIRLGYSELHRTFPLVLFNCIVPRVKSNCCILSTDQLLEIVDHLSKIKSYFWRWCGKRRLEMCYNCLWSEHLKMIPYMSIWWLMKLLKSLIVDHRTSEADEVRAAAVSFMLTFVEYYLSSSNSDWALKQKF